MTLLESVWELRDKFEIRAAWNIEVPALDHKRGSGATDVRDTTQRESTSTRFVL